MGWQMHAVSAAGQRNICPRVDEQPCARAAERLHGLQRQLFQRAQLQVFFAELDHLHSRGRTLSNFF